MLMKRTITTLFTFLLILTHLRADEGMWIPLLLGELNESEMQSMGMNITAEDIYSINGSSLKDAIVIFGGGCTGELISDQGLVLTNHHCGYGRIQSHSSVEHDYLTDGFWAMTKEEELPNPGLSVTFLVRMEEVTGRVLEGVTDDMPEYKRDEVIRANIDSVRARATEGTHYAAVVKPFFYGNRYFLFVNEVFDDVRLVGAPPSNIGKFGGDTDNWVWPRHTGDFSLFRIYADKDNKPAKYSEDNIPYQPRKHFKIALDGVDEDDFTFVFGYPGSTQEYIPSWGIDLQVNTVNPVRIGLRDKRIEIFKKYMDSSPEIRIQYAAKQAGISNGWKKWIGENRGIKRLKVIEKKRQYEQQFAQWANATSERKARYGGLLPAFEELYGSLSQVQYNATYLREVSSGIEVLRYATRFSRLVEVSKDKARNGEMEDQLQRLKQGVAPHFKDYQARVDREVFVALMRDYFDHVDPAEMPEEVKSFRDKHKGDYNAMADAVFEGSLFVTGEGITAFLDDYRAADHKKIEKDPAYQLGTAFSSRYYSTYQPTLRGADRRLDSLMRHYMQAQIDMEPDIRFYPDANFTLRVSYGNVKGFSPDDARNYNYYTTLAGIIEKEDPEVYDYVVEERLKELYRDKDYGPYGEGDGTMRVCFIATNHTTGGNSGSPVLDADGHLVGLNFDRCWESTMSDLYYDISQCRNIALDIRYCLFIIDKFAGAGHLVEEMTIVNDAGSASID